MTDLTMSQFASKDDLIATQAARIAELEAELEAVGAGGVQRLAAAPQAEAIAEIVSASHDQAEFGERAINFLRDFQHLEYGTKLYPAPQAVQAATESVLIDGVAYEVHAEVAVELLRLHIELQQASSQSGEQEERRVCNNEECGWIGPLSETYGYKHSPATLCPECKETTELAAPAHPAEGVPAQANRDAVIQHLTNAGVLEHDGCGVFIASGDASELIDACMTLPLSTHPTQQGMDAGAFEQRMSNWAQEDAQDAARYQWLREQHNKGDDSVAIFIGDEQHGPGHLDAQIDEAIAAQAKQGEQANG